MFTRTEYFLAFFGVLAVATGWTITAQTARCEGSNCSFILCDGDEDCPFDPDSDRNCICRDETPDTKGFCFPLGPQRPPEEPLPPIDGPSDPSRPPGTHRRFPEAPEGIHPPPAPEAPPMRPPWEEPDPREREI